MYKKYFFKPFAMKYNRGHIDYVIVKKNTEVI